MQKKEVKSWANSQTRDLPVTGAIPDLKQALASDKRVVLIAPPGAGKTTVVPLELLDEPWLANKSILMLEPRRLAARGAATRMSSMISEKVGGIVGYRVRFENRVSERTRIEVVTEGILSRRIQNDPELEGVGLIIFDEFHERSIHADVGLALSLDVQSSLRDDLRILVMSATLDGERISGFLSAPLIRAEGRTFPVENRYAGLRKTSPAHAASDAVSALISKSRGDILVFLPGSGDIRRAQDLLEEARVDALICPLYGDLRQEEQDRAITPDPSGTRKVILSTNIAETSLTIEGVTTVIDSGLERRLKLDPRTGLSRLETVRISKSSADQRSGRAGRTGPGVCIRLYDEEEYRRMESHAKPEILEADLAPFALEMALWGTADLRFLDPPPASSLSAARSLLRSLGALDGDTITETGRAMCIPVHPRLARMIVEARSNAQAKIACDLAAILSERDVLRGSGSDLRTRLQALEDARRGSYGPAVHRGSISRALSLATEMRKYAVHSSKDTDAVEPGKLLACAYPDRIARARDEKMERYLLSNGRGAVLPPGDSVRSLFLVAAETRGSGADSSIDLALPVSVESLRELFANQIEIQMETRLEKSGRVQSVRVEKLGALELSVTETSEAVDAGSALLAEVLRQGIDRLSHFQETESLRNRVEFLRRNGEDLPDFSKEYLSANLGEWLGPHIAVMRSISEVQKIDIQQILHGMLSHSQQSILRTHAPESMEVPSGSKISIDYSTPEPALPVKLQELFGLRDTPKIARGKVPLTLHLLSPARRPIQITRDLEGFWTRTYPEVRKELRGRYPRHPWPEDPWTAQPTRFTRKRAEKSD